MRASQQEEVLTRQERQQMLVNRLNAVLVLRCIFEKAVQSPSAQGEGGWRPERCSQF